MPWVAKEGVDLSRLRPEITRLEPTVCACFSAFGRKTIITSTYDGKHLAKGQWGDFHYRDAAIDLRCNDLGGQVQVSLRDCLKRQIGMAFYDKYDIILESQGLPNAHIHIEPNPKLALAMFGEQGKKEVAHA